RIIEEVTGHSLPGLADDQSPFSGREKAILIRIAEEHGVEADLVLKLVDLESRMYGMMRRTAVQSRIDQILCGDWRSREEVLRSAPSLQSREAVAHQDGV